MTIRRLCLMVTSPITATTFLGGYLSFLREDGWDVTLVCSVGEGVAGLVDREGVRFVPLEMKREPSPINDLRSIFCALRLLRQLRPDVLVYATPKASFVGAIAGWIARVPTRVYELWGLRLETATGLGRHVFGFLESLTARLSTMVIANSPSLAGRVTELGVDGGKHILVLGEGSAHGVDAAHFSRDAAMPEIPDDLRAALAVGAAPVVGFVGRLHPDKGVDTLLDALEICAGRGIAFQLLIVGAEEGADLEERLTTLERQAPVHLAGFVRDPRPLLGKMDLLALPSLREGFPTVVLEAAAMEVPAIVSNATGCVDSVVDGETGIIVPVGDATALADALAALLADSEHRSKLGAAARQRVLTAFVPADVRRQHSAAWSQ